MWSSFASSRAFLSLALLLGSSLAQITVIPHDQVAALPQSVPAGQLGQLYLKYKPYLFVANGCLPYPAVDVQGRVSGGLSPTGSPSGGCTNSGGQVYARSGAYNGRFAIMYSWFMPKDEPVTGIGHRYDWEGIVVWLDSAQKTLLGVSASAHGNFNANTSPPLSGTSPLIEYVSVFPLDHSLTFTTTRGGQQPLITWETMSPTVKTSLSKFSFGKANVPFIDSAFQSNLAKAQL